MRNYSHVLERILNTPLLAHPERALTVAGVVLNRVGVSIDLSIPSLADPSGFSFNPLVNTPKQRLGPVQTAALRRGYEARGSKPFLYADGVAVIEVEGSLAHREFNIGAYSGITGYDGLTAQLESALADDEVRGIIFDIHSAGGEVSGAFQLGDAIYAARSQKPVIAVVDEMAFSAGYIIASACEEVWLASETAQCGSIGVVMVHMSFEKMLAKEGAKPTIIKAGEYKADGNPYEDLDEGAVARIQNKIDGVYEIFVSRVSKWRGLSSDSVRGTKAGVFMGREAVEVGLADGVVSPTEVFAALRAETVQTLPLAR